ncbi:MAG: PepSY domain-containing protein [Mogibacterium sp.]|nr:PepSY domain-containing protein [Mogibacterium sp.]
MKRKMNIVLALFTALALVMTMGVSVFAAGISSNDAALKKALKNAGLKKSQVQFIDTEYDSEDGIYEVEFTKKSNGREYDYEIAADTGKIVKKSVDYRYKRNSSHKKIGKTAARKKVAKFSGISYKIIKKGTCYYEYDDGRGIYEVKFEKGSRVYEYDVLAPTGKIVEYEWKVIGY